MGSAPENARHHAEQPQEQKAQDDQEHHVGAHGGGPVVKVNGEDQLIGGTGEIAHVQIDLIQNKGRQPDPQAGPRQPHPGPEPPAQGEVAQGAQPAPGKGQTQQGNGQHGQGKVPGASLPGQARQQENGLKGQIDHRLVPGPVPGQGELPEQEGEQGNAQSKHRPERGAEEPRAPGVQTGHPEQGEKQQKLDAHVEGDLPVGQLLRQGQGAQGEGEEDQAHTKQHAHPGDEEPVPAGIETADQQQQQQAAGEAPQAGQSPPSLWNEGGQQGKGGHHEF